MNHNLAEEGEIKANTDPYPQKNKHTNLSFIAVNQQAEHEDCRHNPIHRINERNRPSRQPELTGKHTKHIKHRTNGDPAQKHHENRMELNVQGHLNNLPRNPLDFSWVFPSTYDNS